MRELGEMNLRIIKQRLLVHEARGWLGFTEQGGDNKGQAVELFQRFVDGLARGEPWCMAFVQFCCDQVDRTVDEFFSMSINHRCLLYKSEHCLTTWNESPDHLRIFVPEAGSIPIWQKGSLSSGHTGIVESVFDVGQFYSLEGNTGPSSKVEREGDGVFRKLRTEEPMGAFHIKGYLRPWDDLLLIDM